MDSNYILTTSGTFISADELYHHGTKGMKWGVRRYQNEDGSLTAAGKKRYSRDAREKGYKEYDDESGTYYKTAGKKGGRKETLDVDADRYVTEDLTRTKKVADDAGQLAGRMKQMNDKTMKNQSKTRLDLSKMSDKELRDQINRELLERQYNDVFNPPKINKGKETASKVLDTAGDVLVVAGAAVGLALSLRELLK